MKPPEEGEIQSIFKICDFSFIFSFQDFESKGCLFGVVLVKHKTANVPAQVVENTQNIKRILL